MNKENKTIPSFVWKKGDFLNCCISSILKQCYSKPGCPSKFPFLVSLANQYTVGLHVQTIQASHGHTVLFRHPHVTTPEDMHTSLVHQCKYAQSISNYLLMWFQK